MRNLFLFLSIVFISVLGSANSSVGNFKVSNPDKMKTETLFVKDTSQIKQGLQKKAIYTIEKQNGITEIAVANSNGAEWEIQKYAVPDSVIENSEFSQFINQSNSVKEWVEIQK